MEKQTTNDLISGLLIEHLEDIKSGIEKYDTTEVLKIKNALDTDRPTADFILTTIFNAISFLHNEFSPQSEEEFNLIMNFLERFYQYTQQELLGVIGTYKEGLAMLPKEEDKVHKKSPKMPA